MLLSKRAFPVAIVLFLLGLTVFLFPPTQHLLSPVPRVHAATRTIVLVGTFTAWNASTTSANPKITVTQGDTVSITLTSTDTTHQFALDVDRDGPKFIAACPSGDTCSTTFTPTAGTTVTFTASFAAGTYTYFCTFHSAMVGSFVVQAPPTPDFTIASSPSSLSFPQGSSSTSTITLTSINSFSGTVNLVATVSPVSPTGPTTSFAPSASVTVPAGMSGTSTLTVSTTSSTLSGTYSIKVNGTGPSTTHSTTVTVQVNAPASADFSITSSPASLNVTQGSSSSSTITLTSINSFSGILSLTDTISPLGPTVTFSPTSVSLAASNSITSTVTVSTVAGATSPVATGTYSLNITATNGSLSHSKVVPVTVSSTTSSLPGTPGLPVAVVVGAAIAIIAAIAVVVYLVRRKPVVT